MSLTLFFMQYRLVCGNVLDIYCFNIQETPLHSALKKEGD